jgi:glycopeptide antibiotics resistance protein
MAAKSRDRQIGSRHFSLRVARRGAGGGAKHDDKEAPAPASAVNIGPGADHTINAFADAGQDWRSISPADATAVTALDRLEPEPFSSAGTRYFSWLGLGYGLLMLYSSTVIGPAGCNFVFLDPARALHQFLALRIVAHGSDQRADWMGNLLMLVPFGFLVTGALWPRRPAFRLSAAIGAMLICTTTILAIKYLQLFFPPRSVTLNYIVAQGLGAMAGCIGFAVWRVWIGRPGSRRDPVAALLAVLRLYCAALLIFLLMPLDFALNPVDLMVQAGRLAATVSALPGEDRPLAVRVMLIAVSSAAFIPAGMLLVFARVGVYRVQRGLPSVMARGLAITTAIFVLSTLVMGATPIMVAIVYRTAGIVTGAAILRWLVRQDATRLRHVLRGLVPWMLPPYLLALLVVNRLVSVHWLSPHEAVEQAYPLGMLPLFDYYIVSKAEAAKNIVGHVVMYMPIGVGLWLRYPERRTAGRAFVLALTLSLAVELGRYSRPGLEGDINAVVLAGLSAMMASWLMPGVWSMLARLARQSAPSPVRVWDKRGAAGEPLGEVEHF